MDTSASCGPIRAAGTRRGKEVTHTRGWRRGVADRVTEPPPAFSDSSESRVGCRQRSATGRGRLASGGTLPSPCRARRSRWPQRSPIAPRLGLSARRWIRLLSAQTLSRTLGDEEDRKLDHPSIPARVEVTSPGRGWHSITVDASYCASVRQSIEPPSLRSKFRQATPRASSPRSGSPAMWPATPGERLCGRIFSHARSPGQ